MNPKDKQRYHAPASQPEGAASPEVLTDELRAAAQAAAELDAQNSAPTGALDWSMLSKELALHGGVRNRVLVAEMPMHPPIRLMSSISDGIYPVRSLLTLRSLRKGT